MLRGLLSWTSLAAPLTLKPRATTTLQATAMADVHVRLAESRDVDRVAAVYVDAMQDNPSWPYRFPYRKEYRDDHWTYQRDLMGLYISPEYNDWTVVIVELKDSSGDHVVSFAVWDTSYANKRAHGPNYVPKSRERFSAR
jgi:hypothetical protein